MLVFATTIVLMIRWAILEHYYYYDRHFGFRSIQVSVATQPSLMLLDNIEFPGGVLHRI